MKIPSPFIPERNYKLSIDEIQARDAKAICWVGLGMLIGGGIATLFLFLIIKH